MNITPCSQLERIVRIDNFFWSTVRAMLEECFAIGIKSSVVIERVGRSCFEIVTVRLALIDSGKEASIRVQSLCSVWSSQLIDGPLNACVMLSATV